MKQEFYPLSVVPAVPRGEGIRFLHPKTQYDITVFTPVVWAILSETNGYQTAKTVVSKVAKQFPEVSTDTITAIINDLRSLGVLADSREAFTRLHELSMNPMRFTQRVTFADIREYTDSSRLPIADGEVLDVSTPNQTGLARLQARRRSCRSFSDEPVNLMQIAHVLNRSYSLPQHTAASAGGLYPLKIYFVVVRDQQDLPAGYYEYDPEKEVCIRFNPNVDTEFLRFAFDSDTLVFDAPVLVVIAADMERHSGKYANRGYRYTVLEAGHVAQNVDLAAAEIGLATLEYGGFSDSVLASELNMDQPRVLPLATIGVGIPSAARPFNAMHLLEGLQSALVGPGKPVRYVRMSTGGRPEDGESFFTATALYKPSPNQSAKKTYRNRFSGGTATSAALAQVKAIAEAYERYVSGLVRVDCVSKATDLDGTWLDPRQVAPLTDEQFRNLPFLQPFNPDLPWEWVKGQTAIGNETVWVPADLVFYPLNNDTFGRKLTHEASSSGVAAYTSFDGAVKRGLLELIERDVIMRNWFRRESPQRIAHDQLPYHWRRRAEYWEARGRDVYVLDFSAYGAVVVNVIITSPDQFPCFVNGSAASIDSFDEAIAKAFHEAELGLLQALKFPPQRPIQPQHVVNPADHAKLYAYPRYLGNLAWLWEGSETPVVPSPTAQIDELLARFNAVLVELSPDNAPLQVVRILSDQLVPVNFGYATEYYTHATIRADQVHPDSLCLPHYFA